MNSSQSKSQVPPSQDAPAQFLDRPPPPPSSPQSHNESTACASLAASCARPDLGVSHLCRSLVSWGLAAIAPKIVPFLRLRWMWEKQASVADW